jgi:uncharacterized protein
MKNISGFKYLPRPIYIKRILPFLETGLIKVLTGQRRVGKSFILFQLMDEIRKQDKDACIIYINKEDYRFEKLKTHEDLMVYVKSRSKGKGRHCLFIDEVQDIQGFELALRSLLTVDGWDIFISGSNATMLSGELASHLSGRYVQFQVHALSYSEFLEFHALPESMESLNRYMRWGGMPHLVNLPKDDAVVSEYLRNIHNTIVLRDIITRFNIRNVRFLQDLITYLAEITGSVVSAKRISDYLKSQNLNMTHKLVLEYLFYLESVFLVDRVKRKDVVGKKVFDVGEKFYFEDLGMRHAIIPFQQKDIAKVLENLVYHQLVVGSHQVFVGKQGDREVDFVATKDDKTTYIQVTYQLPDEKTHEREFGNLLAIPDNHKKMVVSMDETAGGQYKGVEHVHIRQFLTR